MSRDGQMQNDRDSRENVSPGVRISAVGAVINLLLSGLKVTVGLYGNSRALVADGLHSLSDLATDAVVALACITATSHTTPTIPTATKKSRPWPSLSPVAC